MPVKIKSVADGSPCQGRVEAGDTLVFVNGKPVDDVLDYRFYTTEKKLLLTLCGGDGENYTVKIRKGQYEDLGLEFETYLMDKHRCCKNKCIFCFIDQLPRGMRESLYFKDDDSRLSFLFGNYITLTNLSERDVERIIEMKISPVNVSVHTTNPELRVKMMSNKTAGESLKILSRFAQGGIKLNTQLVLCPGFNDGVELERSLSELGEMYPAVQSIAAVPVGLTRHREGLCGLELFTPSGAGEVIDAIDRFNRDFVQKHGEHIAYAADEFYLCAGRSLPDYGYYNDFPQLDNGVGLCVLLEDEFMAALEEARADSAVRNVAVATGKAAYPLIKRLVSAAGERFPGLKAEVYEIDNCFFGTTVTVAGLLTGSDLKKQLSGKPLGERLLIASTMLKGEDEQIFLDDVSLAELSAALGVPVIPVHNSGEELLYNILGNGGKINA